jgi:hypothetical protein
VKRIWTAVAFLSASSAMPAFAYDATFTGKVTMIEPTYMPDGIIFRSDGGAGSCPAGASLTWTVRGNTEAARIANSQAILSALMTAQVAGRTTGVYDNSRNCSVEFIHFL